MKYLMLVGSLFLVACGEIDTLVEPIDSLPVDSSHPDGLVIPQLLLGHLRPSGAFVEVESIYTESNQELVQVAVKINDLFDYNPDFIRVRFSSTLNEWVGTSSGGISIFDNEDDCWENSDHCDLVEVGSGHSGYFAIGENYLAIQNAYCRPSEADYTYHISATVYSIEYFEPIDISAETQIEIQCLQGHDTSQIPDR